MWQYFKSWGFCVYVTFLFSPFLTPAREPFTGGFSSAIIIKPWTAAFARNSSTNVILSGQADYFLKEVGIAKRLLSPPALQQHEEGSANRVIFNMPLRWSKYKFTVDSVTKKESIISGRDGTTMEGGPPAKLLQFWHGRQNHPPSERDELAKRYLVSVKPVAKIPGRLRLLHPETPMGEALMRLQCFGSFPPTVRGWWRGWGKSVVVSTPPFFTPHLHMVRPRRSACSTPGGHTPRSDEQASLWW